MVINEIFSSLQGEGKYMGYPTTFIRFSGCPFSCMYCDTLYAKGNGKKYTISRVMSEVNRLHNQHICITGGEPLLQVDTLPLVYELLSYSYIVSIETSGLVDIEPCEYSRTYSYCMDIKCPCSGMEKLNKFSNLALLKDYDEVKFVVKDIKDLTFAKDTLKKYPTKASIIFSPLNNDLEICHLIKSFLDTTKIKGRLGIQLHKLLNIA